MPQPLRSKSATEWTIADLRQVVEDQHLESFTLELKEDLPLKQGSQGWRSNRRIHASERDGIAKDVVAMANSFGGTIIVGIKESANLPSRAVDLADPLPDIFQLADRLKDSLNSVVDPPISGLEIHPIVADDDSAGYIVLTVPESSRRPHGFGAPPQVYARRGDRSDAAVMQEIQNIFWEARTYRERIDAEIDRTKEEFGNIAMSSDLAISLSLISGRPLSIAHLDRDMRNGRLFADLTYSTFYEIPGIAKFPTPFNAWRPNAYGVESPSTYGNTPQEWSQWTIDASGVVTVSARLSFADTETRNFYPAWVTKTLGHLGGICRLISEHYSYVGTWVSSSNIALANPIVAVHGTGFRRKSNPVAIARPIALRATELESLTSASALSDFADQLWNAFGLSRPEDDYSVANGFEEAIQYKGRLTPP